MGECRSSGGISSEGETRSRQLILLVSFPILRRAIISSHFRGHPSNYPLLHIDAFNAALSRSLSSPTDGPSSSTRQNNELEPVLWVNVPTNGMGGGESGDGGWTSAALCHVEKEGLRFLVPISEEGEVCSLAESYKGNNASKRLHFCPDARALTTYLSPQSIPSLASHSSTPFWKLCRYILAKSPRRL